MRPTRRTPRDLHVGHLVDGRYKLEVEIGRGSMGRVYRARQVRVDRAVAVKLLRSDVSLDAGLSSRFEEEARAIASLKHPSCLTLFDFGYDEALQSLFMVTELVEGDLLSDLVGYLTASAILRVAYDMADALKYAHDSGLVHRDLKPENVMLTVDADGRTHVKILDFGLARLLDSTREAVGDEASETGAPRIHGSPRYMSPEQCRGEADVGAPSDMYSFGTMIYELYESRAPFDHESVSEVMMAQLSDEPPTMTSHHVPPDVEQLVYALLSKEPGARPTASDARAVVARHSDVLTTGPQPIAEGLAETTLDSEAYEEATGDVRPPAGDHEASAQAEDGSVTEPPDEVLPENETPLRALRTSREARVGAMVGAAVTFVFCALMLAIFLAIA